MGMFEKLIKFLFYFFLIVDLKVKTKETNKNFIFSKIKF